MEDLIFVTHGVIPLFSLIWLGYIIRKIGMLSEETISQLSKVCFNLFLSSSIFLTILKTDIKREMDVTLVLYLGTTLLIATIISSLIVPRFVKNRGQVGSIIHGACRPNIVTLGLPLAINLLDSYGSNQMAIAVAVLLPLININAVVVLSIFSDSADSKLSPKSFFMDLSKNPLLLGSLAGIICSYFELSLPQILLKPLSDLAATGAPIAMLLLGAKFDFKSAFSHMKINLATAIAKLVVWPLLFTSIAMMLGYVNSQLAIIFIFHAVPTAASGAMLAHNMGCDEKVAGEIILVTSALSIFTIFCGSLLLRSMGII